jgi:transposase
VGEKLIEKQKDKSSQIQLVSVESLVPKNHLLRKINKVMDFEFIYRLVEDKYSKDIGRPSIDPKVLVKMVLIQHLFGIRSLRQTTKEVEVNIAYRWFLGYDFTDKIPHFSTLSYNFLHKFTPEIFEEIFTHILEEAIRRDFIKAETIFIDATHIKANANKHKRHKEAAKVGARIYDAQLRQEIDEDRKARGKKPLKDKDDDDDKNSPSGGTREITVSNTDPDSGIFRKGEHKVEFAYTTSTACDKNGFVLGNVTTAGNIHDSKVFDEIYDKVTDRFREIENVTVDAGYKTPWICKKIIDDKRNPSMPYKRPMNKKEFFKPYEYVYDEYYDCVICPNNQVLKYVTTDRNGYRQYKSNPQVCSSCPHLKKCTHSLNHQKVAIKHIWQNYIERAEDFRHSYLGKATYALRSQTIERVFADAKEKHSMRYTPYRGIKRVSGWITLKFACMNLKKMALWA